MQKILIVEDERRLSDAVVDVLKNAGYSADTAYDGTDGYEKARTGKYDIIILDLMLPGMDGIDICKQLKQEGVNTPIIMVTARAAISDRIEGLDAGADDYLPKPFSPQELVARLRALSRRFGRTPYTSSVRYGDLEFSYDTGELGCNGEMVSLSEKERLMMAELMKEPGKVCKKEELLEAVWGEEESPELNNVEAYISFLRKKLAFLGCKTSIQTLRKLGYRLEA